MYLLSPSNRKIKMIDSRHEPRVEWRKKDCAGDRERERVRERLKKKGEKKEVKTWKMMRWKTESIWASIHILQVSIIAQCSTIEHILQCVVCFIHRSTVAFGHYWSFNCFCHPFMLVWFLDVCIESMLSIYVVCSFPSLLLSKPNMFVWFCWSTFLCVGCGFGIWFIVV